MHVYEKAIECGIGDVFVTTCDEEIISEVKKMEENQYLQAKIIILVRIELLRLSIKLN